MPREVMAPPHTACRLAVIGVGPLAGWRHCQAIKGLRGHGAELACICRRRADNMERLGEHGVPLYTDAYQMMCEEPLEGVVIATPTHTHLPIARACIAGAQARQAALGGPQQGLRAILVETPLCEDLHTALELVEIAEDAGVAVLVGRQQRHSPFVTRARELVANGKFGRFQGFTTEFALLKPDAYFKTDDPRLAWRGHEERGGPLLTNLVHDIDLMRYITGQEVISVFAATSRVGRGGKVEGTGVVTAAMDHGAIGTLFFSDVVPSPWSYEFTTLEDKGYLAVPGDGPNDCYHFMGAQRSLGFPSLRSSRYGAEVTTPGCGAHLVLEREGVVCADPIEVQMAHFLRICGGDERPRCSGRDALQSLAVIAAALRSAETRTPQHPGDLVKQAAADLLWGAVPGWGEGE